MLRVKSVWSVRWRDQFAIGKVFGSPAMPERKWFFQVQITCSAGLVRWMLGEVYWNHVFSLQMKFFMMRCLVVHFVELIQTTCHEIALPLLVRERGNCLLRRLKMFEEKLKYWIVPFICTLKKFCGPLQLKWWVSSGVNLVNLLYLPIYHNLSALSRGK